MRYCNFYFDCTYNTAVVVVRMRNSKQGTTIGFSVADFLHRDGLWNFKKMKIYLKGNENLS
jgi:hypothetical protein